MSFGNYSNQNIKNTQIEKKKIEIETDISKNVFKESLKFLDKQWDIWNDDINKLKKDSSNLERMFNLYDKDPKYLELRNNIIKRIEQKKYLLCELEQRVLTIKLNINTITSNN